jgi:hypothetical protein
MPRGRLTTDYHLATCTEVLRQCDSVHVHEEASQFPSRRIVQIYLGASSHLGIEYCTVMATFPDESNRSPFGARVSRICNLFATGKPGHACAF